MYISSRQNALFKALLRVSRGKRLRNEIFPEQLVRPVLLEGRHLCQEWLAHQGVPIQALFDEQALKSDVELQRLARQVGHERSMLMATELLAALSHIGASQGVVFLVNALRPPVPIPTDVHALWLDRVQDPGNVGTLLRTAAAAGMDAVMLSEGCARAWSARVLRGAQGAHFALPIYEEVDLEHLASRLTVPLHATGLGPHTVSLYDVALTHPCVWVVGHEGQGVDPALLTKAAHIVHIPQDDRVESLNVAVAAAICLFEQRRQRHAQAD